jgi:hypothetical protein
MSFIFVINTTHSTIFKQGKSFEIHSTVHSTLFKQGKVFENNKFQSNIIVIVHHSTVKSTLL